MPELPEVETIVRSLKKVVGCRVKEVRLLNPAVVKRHDYLPADLQNKTIEEIGRRGKFLHITCKGGLYLVLHLGMTGRFYLEESSVSHPRHLHLICGLKEPYELRYVDARRFGGVWFTLGRPEFFDSLGPEPLEEGFTPEYLKASLAAKKGKIKSLLLDQKVVSGLGNIYVDEALFVAGIRPQRPGCTLSEEEVKKLHQAIRQVLEESIKHRGTTFRDYRDGFNLPGGFQEHLCVYGRAGRPCPVCGLEVSKVKIGGRSSHFCPGCQK